MIGNNRVYPLAKGHMFLITKRGTTSKLVTRCMREKNIWSLLQILQENMDMSRVCIENDKDASHTKQTATSIMVSEDILDVDTTFQMSLSAMFGWK